MTKVFRFLGLVYHQQFNYNLVFTAPFYRFFQAIMKKISTQRAQLN